MAYKLFQVTISSLIKNILQARQAVCTKLERAFEYQIEQRTLRKSSDNPICPLLSSRQRIFQSYRKP